MDFHPAHAAASAPDLVGVLTAWPFEPLAWVGLAGVTVLYLRGWARASMPEGRPKVWFLLGVSVVALALVTPVAAYAHDLLWVHMIQHLLLTLVAAPLLLLGRPATIALRALRGPGRRRFARVLGSSGVRIATHPLVTWVTFAAVMWSTHLTGIYDLALSNEAVHALEHAAYLSVGLLFWLPVVAADPLPHKLPWPGRIAYLVSALPQQSFLALALYSADGLLYPHYASVVRTWGPSPLVDQDIAATLMWLGGDALLIGALVLTLAAWMRHEQASEGASPGPVGRPPSRRTATPGNRSRT